MRGHLQAVEEQWVSEGFHFRDQPEWQLDRVVDELVKNLVEVSVHLDYDVVTHDDAAAAARRVYIAIERREDQP